MLIVEKKRKQRKTRERNGNIMIPRCVANWQEERRCPLFSTFVPTQPPTPLLHIPDFFGSGFRTHRSEVVSQDRSSPRDILPRVPLVPLRNAALLCPGPLGLEKEGKRFYIASFYTQGNTSILGKKAPLSPHPPKGLFRNIKFC